MFEFTKDSDNPDLREKGFVYWRLLSIDPNLASLIVLSEKPKISEDASNYESSFLDLLLNNLGTLATIYLKPPELFVKKTRAMNMGEEEEAEYEESAFELESENEVQKSKRKDTKLKSNKEDDKNHQEDPPIMSNNQPVSINSDVNLIDINDILGGSSASNTSIKTPNSNPNAIQLDVLNLFDNNVRGDNLINAFNTMTVDASSPLVVPKQVVWNENGEGFVNKNQGLIIEAAVQRERSGALFLLMKMENLNNRPIQVSIFNKSS